MIDDPPRLQTMSFPDTISGNLPPEISDALATETSAAVSPQKPSKPATNPTRLRLTELLHKKFDIRSVALTGLFILAIFYTIYFMRAVLLPLVLALLLSYLLRPVVRAFKRARIPAAVSAAVLLMGLLFLIGYGVSILSVPAAGWLE